MTKQEELAVKLARVEQFLSGNGLDGVILGRSDSFAWVGCGANNVINSAEEGGVGALAVEPGRVTLIANNIETQRLMTEELAGLDLAGTETFPWHDPAQRDAIVQRLTAGKSFAADDGSAGLPALPDGFVALRYALTEGEIARYRVIGADAAQAMEDAAHAVDKGMTEADVAALVAGECQKRGILPIVLLVAADDRIRSWRHPPAKTAPVEQYVMIVICGRREGLVAAVTRFVHFGDVPEDLKSRHNAVCAVDTAMILATTPGKPASQIFAEAQQAYAANGHPDEWQNHHQGGGIGYQPREFIATPGCAEIVQVGQAFAWNPSICGTKSEDTILVTEDGFEVLTPASTDWPAVDVETAGQTVSRANFLVK
ncbi:MAG: M24 family metallopeptidase [Planctomycetota bacterium]|jgi:antitoxin VapB